MFRIVYMYLIKHICSLCRHHFHNNSKTHSTDIWWYSMNIHSRMNILFLKESSDVTLLLLHYTAYYVCVCVYYIYSIPNWNARARQTFFFPRLFKQQSRAMFYSFFFFFFLPTRKVAPSSGLDTTTTDRLSTFRRVSTSDKSISTRDKCISTLAELSEAARGRYIIHISISSLTTHAGARA